MIHNISIATDDDIIQFGNDVNIYTVFIEGNRHWGNCLNWLEKTIVSYHIFVKFLYADFATYLWPLSVCLNPTSKV